MNLDRDIAHIRLGVAHLMNLMELALTNQNEILSNMKARLATPSASPEPEDPPIEEATLKHVKKVLASEVEFAMLHRLFHNSKVVVVSSISCAVVVVLNS
jgi:hypothetical protein